jgi:GTP-binding protein
LQKDVVLLGPPGTGKSSLLARLTEVLPKISLNNEISNSEWITTLSPVVGFLKFIDNQQIAVMELPGVVLDVERKVHLKVEYMNQVEGASLYCFMFDLTHPDLIFQINYFISNKHIFTKGKDTFFILNKMDLVPKEHVEKISGYLNELHQPFMTISIEKNKNISEFVKYLREKIIN